MAVNSPPQRCVTSFMNVLLPDFWWWQEAIWAHWRGHGPGWDEGPQLHKDFRRKVEDRPTEQAPSSLPRSLSILQDNRPEKKRLDLPKTGRNNVHSREKSKKTEMRFTKDYTFVQWYKQRSSIYSISEHRQGHTSQWRVVLLFHNPRQLAFLNKHIASSQLSMRWCWRVFRKYILPLAEQ